MSFSSTVQRSNAARRRPGHRAAIGLVASLALAACGSGSSSGAAAGAGSDGSAPDGKQTTTAPAASSDGDLAAQALLAPDDLEGEWELLGAEVHFPNGAALARTVPACAEYAELLFEGGTEHGEGVSATLSRGEALLFSYVVVFPDAEAAAAMVAAASTPGFDECWARFNEAAVVEMPFGITSGTYANATPPALDFDADASTVKYLTGSVVVGGSTLADTCVCVFAQHGRGVVEVHSPVDVLAPAERSAAVQQAVDKLAAVLD